MNSDTCKVDGAQAQKPSLTVRLSQLLIEALNTDGEHHKQASLFEALQMVDPLAAEAHEYHNGDIGIPS